MYVTTPMLPRSRRLLILAAGIIVALTSVSVAIAAIVSGTSTTNISAHVTYTQLIINKPAVSAGDVMIASIAVLDGTIAGVTAPSGWTQIARTDNDINVALVSYYKVAGTSEPSTYTWTIDEQTKAVGGITPYSGVNTANPIDAVAGNAGFGTVATTTAVVAASANSQVLTLFATDVNKTFGTPTGMTQKYNLAHLNAGPLTAAFDVTQVSAGNVTSKSSAISGNKARSWSSQVIVLRPFVPANVPSPVAYWKLDTNSSDAVAVSHGTDTNIAYSTANGKINEGAGLDGSSSKIDFDPVVSGVVNLSVAAWVKSPGVISPTNEQHIVAQRSLATNPGQWQLYLQQHKLNFYSSGSGGNPIASNASIDDGNWHLVGVSQSGSTYTIYVDGVVDNVVTQGSPTDYQTSAIGGAIGYDRRIGASFFGGAIDEVGVWNTTLSATDFAALYNAGAGRQYPF